MLSSKEVLAHEVAAAASGDPEQHPVEDSPSPPSEPVVDAARKLLGKRMRVSLHLPPSHYGFGLASAQANALTEASGSTCKTR